MALVRELNLIWEERGLLIKFNRVAAIISKEHIRRISLLRLLNIVAYHNVHVLRIEGDGIVLQHIYIVIFAYEAGEVIFILRWSLEIRFLLF